MITSFHSALLSPQHTHALPSLLPLVVPLPVPQSGVTCRKRSRAKARVCYVVFLFIRMARS